MTEAASTLPAEVLAQIEQHSGVYVTIFNLHEGFGEEIRGLDEALLLDPSNDGLRE